MEYIISVSFLQGDEKWSTNQYEKQKCELAVLFFFFLTLLPRVTA
jgi:hypothetical protein